MNKPYAKIMLTLLFLMFSSLASCFNMVGGSCSYEAFKQTAKIVKISSQRISFRLSSGMTIEGYLSHKSASPKVGDIYHVEYEVIREGSCTPIGFLKATKI